MSFEFKLPDIGEGVVEGEIVSWFVEKGDSIEEDQPLVEIMTDKVTVEIPSPRNGQITERIGEEGQIIEVGTTLVVIAESETDTVNKNVRAKSKTQNGKKTSAIPPQDIKLSTDTNVLTTPAIRKMAHQMSIDLNDINGTGSGGRIVQEDLYRHHNNQADIPEDTETIPYRGLRRKIGSQLLLSKKTIPHYTYVEEVDVTELVILKTKLDKNHKDIRLTYLPFVMKAVAAGLKE